jgi:protein-disulfide isomerase
MIRDNLTTAFSKNIRVYFKDFPLEQIHNWAKPAAIAGRCVFRQEMDKFWNFHDWIFANQEQTTLANLRSRLEGFGVDQKLDVPALLQCFDSKATEAEVTRNFAEGRALEINSTPTIFVNGRRLSGSVSWEQLKQIIEFEIEYQKTAKNAGENCGCELKLPSPLN